ncbi:hypothetical protein E4K10_14680 [Streptomyces sp. T1317-0309]|nr:hypothetical protein E4K10_14680 [Streptomyces sp. T1317-0309]
MGPCQEPGMTAQLAETSPRKEGTYVKVRLRRESGSPGLISRLLFAVLLAPLFALTPTLANAQGVWLTLPHLNTARQSLAGATAPCPKGVAGLSGTCVYAIGGNDGTGVVGTLEAYSPATNRWVALPSMPTARQSLAGAAAPCPKVSRAEWNLRVCDRRQRWRPTVS